VGEWFLSGKGGRKKMVTLGQREACGLGRTGGGIKSVALAVRILPVSQYNDI